MKTYGALDGDCYWCCQVYAWVLVYFMGLRMDQFERTFIVFGVLLRCLVESAYQGQLSQCNSTGKLTLVRA